MQKLLILSRTPFDTIKSPNTNDKKFLPNSDKKWNTYNYKLHATL